MIDRNESTREAPGSKLARVEHHPYEPPTLTTLGSFAELTQVAKSGAAADPGNGFQPSQQ
jgi:hypothetical protein